MLILDLRWTLVIILILIAGGIAFFLWMLARKQHQLEAQIPLLTFPTALDSAPFGLLLIQGDAVLYMNPKAQALLSFDAADIPESEWAHLLKQDLHAAAQGLDHQGIRRSVIFSSNHAVTWWVIPGHACMAVFVLDLSEQHHVQYQTDALIHDLGHELRTPIATMLTHLDILGFEDVGSDIREQSLLVTKQETQRLSRLVEDLLQLGRVSTNSMTTRRPTDVVKLVEGVLAQTHPIAAQQDAVISLQAPDNLPHFSIDPDQIRQVFLNLIDNALKYGADGVNITVQIVIDAHGLVCRVRDDGPGIPLQHLSRVTERFYRTAQRDIQGSGLGLALVTEILRQHKSSLELISPDANDRGTRAQFTLPLEEGQ